MNLTELSMVEGRHRSAAVKASATREAIRRVRVELRKLRKQGADKQKLELELVALFQMHKRNQAALNDARKQLAEATKAYRKEQGRS